jgi:transcriptional regulator with XRE-family HTH domain
MSPLPPQTELQRRVRVLRALRGLTVRELAERIGPDAGMSERTLGKMEGGGTKLREGPLRTIAAALDTPYVWFTATSIEDLFAPTREQEGRLAAIEQLVGELEDQEPGCSNY